MTQSDFVRHVPCEACGSSDANSLYTDGHTHCFACGARTKADNGEPSAPPTAPIERTPMDFLSGECLDLSSRRIKRKTCERYGYQVGELRDGTVVQIAPYYRNGKLAAQHTRDSAKNFRWINKPDHVELFGQRTWQTGGQRLVITEGELDALSVAEAFNLRLPVVSLPNGSNSVKKALTDNIEFIESFEEVVLAFDNDAPGSKAVEEAVDILKPGKAHIVAYPLDVKDMSDLKQAGRVKDIVQCILRAAKYRPDGVVSGTELWDSIQQEPERGMSYPWQSVTEWTLGIRPHEFLVFGAGTGMGKTDFFKEIALHLMVEHDQTVGLVFLEEMNRDTALTMMSKYAGIPMHVPGAEYSKDVKKQAYEKAVGNGKLFMYDHYGACDFESVKSRIRYMVVSCGCKYVFLDHITALTDGETSEQAVNQRMRNIVSELAQMTRELGFTLFTISHLRKPQGTPHEEGGRVHLNDFYGASAIKQWANFAFGIERDQQADDPLERCTSTLRCLKDRLRGVAAGNTCFIRYDVETTRQQEVDNTFTQEESF